MKDIFEVESELPAEIKISIELQDEEYFKGQRVSQVIISNVNQLLVALWEESGFYRIQRSTYDHQITYIADETGVPNNYHCTDLIGIKADPTDSSSFIQYFIARTETAINIIDTVKEKIYCLAEEPNYKHKFRKAAVIPKDIDFAFGSFKDKVNYQIIYVCDG